MIAATVPSANTVWTFLDAKLTGLLAVAILLVALWRIVGRLRDRFRGAPILAPLEPFSVSPDGLIKLLRDKLEHIVWRGNGILVPFVAFPILYVGVTGLAPLFERYGFRGGDGFLVSALLTALICAWLGWDDRTWSSVPDPDRGGTKREVRRHVLLGLSVPKWAFIISVVGLVEANLARERPAEPRSSETSYEPFKRPPSKTDAPAAPR